MTAPAVLLPPPMLPPAVSVWCRGVMLADGRQDGDPLAPMVLDNLLVQWGRSTILDQPPPATCTLTLLDVLGGQSFLDVVAIGNDIQVRADAMISPDPDQSGAIVVMDLDFSGAPPPIVTSNAGYAIQGGQLYAWAVDATRAAVLTFPPGPLQPVGGNPAAWDAIPRSSSGQTWKGSAVRVSPAPAFAGWGDWASTLRPVAYGSPWDTPTALAPLDASGLFVPPDGVWLGLRVTLFPTGPLWQELDGSPWNTWGSGGVLTNLATNPAPASINGWSSNNGAAWSQSYAAGEIVVDWIAADGNDPNAVASWYNAGFLGNANPVVPAETYQRSIEIWVDAPATLVGIGSGSFTGGQALAANQWTRVVEQFTGTGAAMYALAGAVRMMPGAGFGVHVKLRRAQLVANPGGQTVPYFDGSTPDANGIDYAWTGAANASTSTATDVRSAGPTWDAVSRFSIDDVLLVAPPAGTQRSALVFSGRITDMEARFDGDASLVDITAQDQRAELANRDVGDQPWPMERLDTRVARVISASGQPINYQIDSSAAPLQVSWRDVDRQGALTLLQELAITGDTVLWAATHLTTGPYLDFESLSQRPALSGLYQGADGVVVIGPVTSVPGSVELAACDLGRDPVRWIQDVADLSTRVAVTWREQTVNDEGQPAPTDRVETVGDASLEAQVGSRRIAVSTQLTTSTDGATLATNLLGRTSTPGWRLSGVVWDAAAGAPMNSDQLSRMMTLLDGTTRNGCPIVVTDLPAWSPIAGRSELALFVEGGSYTSIGGGWQLDLTTSNPTAAGRSATWDEFPAAPHPVTAWRWQDMHPDVRWVDLSGTEVT